MSKARAVLELAISEVPAADCNRVFISVVERVRVHSGEREKRRTAIRVKGTLSTVQP